MLLPHIERPRESRAGRYEGVQGHSKRLESIPEIRSSGGALRHLNGRDALSAIAGLVLLAST